MPILPPAALFAIDGKIALVTGGTSGIGRMIAEGLVAAGAKVYVTARTAADVDATTAALGCHGIVADLGTNEGVAAVGAALADEGQLDILVNNAGTVWLAPIEEFPREGFARVLDLNVSAPFMLVQALLPLLRVSARPGDPARVINIASIGAFRAGGWDNFSYSPSKAALISLTQHLGARLAGENISVNAIAPGLFPSRLTDEIVPLDDPAVYAAVASPLGNRVGTAEDIAGAVIYLASRAGAWLTGVTLPVSGGRATID